MKLLLTIFSFLSLFMLSGFTQISHLELPVTFEYDYTLTTNVLLEGILEIEVNVNNELNYDINYIILYIDIYQDDILVDQIFLTLETDIIHRSNQTVIFERSFDRVDFNHIEITSFSIAQATFFKSYSATIFMGVFFGFVLFVMWMVGDINRHLILSEVNEILKDHWWKVLIIVLIFPLIINILLFLFRLHVLSTIYGWVFYITSIISTITFYGILMLYHFVTER